MKTCTKCLESKQLEEFPFDRRTKDGRVTICRACTKIQQAAWRDANRAHWNAKSRQWVENNPERYRAIQTRWHTSEDALEQRRQWKRNNPDKVADINGKRRAIKAGVTVEDVDRNVVWSRDGGVCHICNEPADPTDWHLEHVLALANGGTHSYNNVAVSHPSCNLRKAAKCL